VTEEKSNKQEGREKVWAGKKGAKGGVRPEDRSGYLYSDVRGKKKKSQKRSTRAGGIGGTAGCGHVKVRSPPHQIRS